jgi:hypothetical protein
MASLSGRLRRRRSGNPAFYRVRRFDRSANAFCAVRLRRTADYDLRAMHALSAPMNRSRNTAYSAALLNSRAGPCWFRTWAVAMVPVVASNSWIMLMTPDVSMGGLLMAMMSMPFRTLLSKATCSGGCCRRPVPPCGGRWRRGRWQTGPRPNVR